MEYITARGGEVELNSRLQEIELADDGNVAAFRLTDGRRVEGDLYISSMPGGAVSPRTRGCGNFPPLRMLSSLGFCHCCMPSQEWFDVISPCRASIYSVDQGIAPWPDIVACRASSPDIATALQCQPRLPCAQWMW